MVSVALVSGGVAVAVATALVARLTRHRPRPEPEPGEGWAALAPRAIEDVERERPRVWPALGILAGLVLFSVGFVVPDVEPAAERITLTEPTPRPYLVEVTIATAPTPEPTPSPTPTPSATPTPVAPQRSQPATSGGQAPGTTGGGAPAPAPPPPPSPTPPPPPGPSLNASTSCFNNVMQIGYSASALSGTTLATLRVNLNGATVQQPSVSGRQHYSGNYQRSTTPGEHRFTVRVTGSDGGVTVRTFPVRCM